MLLIGGRERMHGLVQLVPQDEILTAGKFLILAGIIMPLLPDTRLVAAAADALPYLAHRGCDLGPVLSDLPRPTLPSGEGWRAVPGAAGRPYSSTAATVVLAKRQREAAAPRAELAAEIVAATAIMFLRLAVVVALFSLPSAATLAPALALLCAAAGLFVWREWRRVERGAADNLAIPAANLLQLSTALLFAALFVVISLATVWVESQFGRTGIFTLAAFVGASDIDPFVLNLAQGGAPGMSLPALAAAVLIAASANNLAKAGYAIGFGGLARTRSPAEILVMLALLGFAAAAV